MKTSHQPECPACESKAIEPQSYERDLEYKGADLHVADLEQCHCTTCDYAFETHEQHDANIARIKAAFLAYRSSYKTERGLLTGSDIKQIRIRLNLYQQYAARLFGGGLNAFSKYENEEVVQSVGMDRLLRLVAMHPALLTDLAQIAGEQLSENKIIASPLISQAVQAKVPGVFVNLPLRKVCSLTQARTIGEFFNIGQPELSKTGQLSPYYLTFDDPKLLQRNFTVFDAKPKDAGVKDLAIMNTQGSLQ